MCLLQRDLYLALEKQTLGLNDSFQESQLSERVVHFQSVVRLSSSRSNAFVAFGYFARCLDTTCSRYWFGFFVCRDRRVKVLNELNTSLSYVIGHCEGTDLLLVEPIMSIFMPFVRIFCQKFTT